MISIYSLSCPITNEVRYIGKAQYPKQRFKSHVSRALVGKKTGHSTNWIRSLLKQNLMPILNVIFEVPENEEWQYHEKRLIAEHLIMGCRLTNLTGGGEGFYKPDPELLARRGRSISRYLNVPENNAKFRARMKIAQSKPSTRKAKSISLMSAWRDENKRQNFLNGMHSESGRLNRSKASKRRFEDPEQRRKHSENMKSLFANDPSRGKKLFEALINSWSDPEQRAARVAGIIAGVSTPEAKENLRLAMIEVNSRPEVKAKRSEKSKQNWADEKYRKSLLTHLQSDEFRTERSEEISARWQDEEARKKLLDGRWDEESRKKQAAELEARRPQMLEAMTPEIRAKQGKKMEKVWERRKANPEEMAELNAKRLAGMTPEGLARIGAATKARWDKYRAEKAALEVANPKPPKEKKKRVMSEEGKLKMAAAAQAREERKRADPEAKAAYSEKMKALRTPEYIAQEQANLAAYQQRKASQQPNQPGA